MLQSRFHKRKRQRGEDIGLVIESAEERVRRQGSSSLICFSGNCKCCNGCVEMGEVANEGTGI